jgi:hypothetical protein
MNTPRFFDFSCRSVVAVVDDVAVNVPHESATGRTRELRPVRVKLFN